MKLTFTEWLETELLKQGLNKKQLSERIAFSTTLVYQIAMGDRKPSAEFMIACAKALNADPVAVLRLAGILPPAPGDTADEWEQAAWTAVQQVAPEHRDAALLALRAWASHDP